MQGEGDHAYLEFLIITMIIIVNNIGMTIKTYNNGIREGMQTSYILLTLIVDLVSMSVVSSVVYSLWCSLDLFGVVVAPHFSG